jgi:biopolymer transport protein ExbD
MSFGRLERSRPARPFSEINMTPLIDVMLVLLVIFIVAAPLLASRLALELPRTQAGAAAAEAAPAAVLRLSVDASGALYVDEQPVTAAELQARVRAAAASQPDTEVQLRADERVPYGRVAELMGWVQAGGLLRMGFITAPVTDQDAAGGAATPPPDKP